MPTETIRISETVYRALAQEAAARQQSPDRFAEEWLARHLLP
jgi:predicted HicB family RNase H-like nuclease